LDELQKMEDGFCKEYIADKRKDVGEEPLSKRRNARCSGEDIKDQETPGLQQLMDVAAAKPLPSFGVIHSQTVRTAAVTKIRKLLSTEGSSQFEFLFNFGVVNVLERIVADPNK
jgi:hypothetical protein